MAAHRAILRRYTGYGAGFPDPYRLAQVANVSVHVVQLPGLLTELAGEGKILCHPSDDSRELGQRVFRGLASLLVDPGSYSLKAVRVLACRLAAPPVLMRSVGIAETISRQPHITEDDLLWWWLICL